MIADGCPKIWSKGGELAEQREERGTAHQRDVEILVVLGGALQEPRRLLKHDDVPGAAVLGPLQFGAQPAILLGEQLRRLLWRVNERGVEHAAREPGVPKGEAVRPEGLNVDGDGRRRRDVPDLVVAVEIVDGNRAVDLREDAAAAGDLRGVAGLVDEIRRSR